MNNKKLFKGALVLFASILMAVSCSSNSKPGDDDTNKQPGGDDTGGNQPTAITTSDISSAVFAGIGGTTGNEVALEVSSSGSGSAQKNINIAETAIAAVFAEKNITVTLSAKKEDTPDSPAVATLKTTMSGKLAKIKEELAKKGVKVTASTISSNPSIEDESKVAVIELTAESSDGFTFDGVTKLEKLIIKVSLKTLTGAKTWS